MRKIIFTLCLIGSTLLILESMGVFDSLLLFLTDGILPGTDAVISAIGMLVVCSLSVIIVLSITVSAVVRYISINRLAKQYMLKKKRTQKRRYSQA